MALEHWSNSTMRRVFAFQQLVWSSGILDLLPYACQESFPSAGRGGSLKITRCDSKTQPKPNQTNKNPNPTQPNQTKPRAGVIAWWGGLLPFALHVSQSSSISGIPYGRHPPTPDCQEWFLSEKLGITLKRASCASSPKKKSSALLLSTKRKWWPINYS